MERLQADHEEWSRENAERKCSLTSKCVKRDQLSPTSECDTFVPNQVHQADLLFLHHDRLMQKSYKYALAVLDVALRYKQAEPLATKEANEAADALRGYVNGALFAGQCCFRSIPVTVLQLLDKYMAEIRRGRVKTETRALSNASTALWP